MDKEGNFGAQKTEKVMDCKGWAIIVAINWNIWDTAIAICPVRQQ